MAPKHYSLRRKSSMVFLERTVILLGHCQFVGKPFKARSRTGEYFQTLLARVVRNATEWRKPGYSRSNSWGRNLALQQIFGMRGYYRNFQQHYTILFLMRRYLLVQLEVGSAASCALQSPNGCLPCRYGHHSVPGGGNLWWLHHFQLIRPYVIYCGAPRRLLGSLVEYWAVTHAMPPQRLARCRSCRTVSSCVPRLITRIAQLNLCRIMALAIALVFVGGAVGSMWRYWWSGFVAQRFGEMFPFGTLVVNLVGSILIGIFSGLLVHVSNSSLAAALQQFLVVGICGGLTTFSSFSLQTCSLITDGRWLAALSNIVFSLDFLLGALPWVGKSRKGLNLESSTPELWNFRETQCY
jgi:fluoride exporter